MTRIEPFPNLVAMFLTRAAAKGDAPFLWRKASDAWQATSWAEAARQVASLAAALRAIGIRPGDRVMLVAENRPEWGIADLAIMAAGAVTVPTYVTNTERDHLHIVENSGAAAVIVSTAKLAQVLLPALVRSAEPPQVIGIEPMRVPAASLTYHDWHALIAAHPADPADLAATVAGIGRGDLACIIYTSGTGGAPRGVMQSHGAILHNVAGCAAVILEDFAATEGDVFLSFLPLSHAYEHSGGLHLPIGLGGQIYYAESLERLAANIEEVRPMVMIVVPRLFEVLRARMLKAIAQQGPLAQRLLARALALGAKDEAGTLTLADRAVRLVVDRLFTRRVSRRFGGRLKALVSGGAPLNPEIGVFFRSLGVMLLQGYGQTEAGPVIACNRPRAGIRMDTVGPPILDTEVRIADDGEILVRGELVMLGYWRAPEETARALADGWLHTGDIGALDAGGRLRITDRKKDLIVNDKGENVAPQKVEGMLTLRPEIGQAMIAGDRRPYMVAVLVPDAGWLGEHPGLSADAVHAALDRAVSAVNRELSVTERIRRFIVADEGFTIENAQLTPSLKIRRHVIRAAYGERLDALYRG